MTRNKRWMVLTGVAVVLTAIVINGHLIPAIGQPAPAGVPAVQPPADPLFELRVYSAAPGKMDALNKRFRDHTLKFFAKHGIKSVGFWTAIDEKHQGKLYYIVAYPDRQSREKMLMNGIAKDPEFLKAVADSEVDGKLTSEIESVLMSATDYSPLK